MYSVIVPTLNAASDWQQFAEALLKCVAPERVLVIDSESTDGTPQLARDCGFKVVDVPRREFNHGRTRQHATGVVKDSDIYVFLTQDAILAGPDSINLLLDAFEDPSIGASFGRQLPRPNSGPIERHARLFNYPQSSSVRSLESRREMGFKCIFLSNSFAAYRQTAFEEVGGFPDDVILGEDTVVAAHMLMAGWKIKYVAEAEVYHSHAYSCLREFRRYFDTGVLHARESWLRQEFGGASGEGKRFILSELAHLWPRHATIIPSAFVRTAAKWMGYRLGLHESNLAPRLKRHFSMHRSFWNG